MAARVNLMIPDTLLKRAHNLIDDGFFSNFSEIIREGIRKEIRDYEKTVQMSDEERKLFEFLKKEHKKGRLYTEEDMDKLIGNQDSTMKKRLNDVKKHRMKGKSENELDEYLKTRGI